MKFKLLKIGIGLLFLFLLANCSNKNRDDHCRKKRDSMKSIGTKIKTVFGPWQAVEKETIYQSGDTIDESIDSSRTTKHRKSPLKNGIKIKTRL